MSSPNRSEVDVWEWQGTPHVVQKLQQPKGGRPNGLRYSLDGRLLAGAHGVDEENELLRVWNATTGEFLAEISDPEETGSALDYARFAFTPDGRFLIRGQTGLLGVGDPAVDTIALHDTKTWVKAWALRTPSFYPYALEVSRDGHFAAVVGWEREMARDVVLAVQTKLLLIDLLKRSVVSSTVIMPNNWQVRFAVWNPDGRQIAVSGIAYDGSRAELKLIDTGTAKAVVTVSGGNDTAALDYSPNGKYLVVGWLNVGIEIWNAAHTKLFQRIPGHTSAAKFAPDGRLAVAEAGDITIWDLK